MAILLLVALMSLILGRALAKKASYIVVSSLMAPVIFSVGAQSGLLVPLIAVHQFVFYFGILADDTPPVGLAASRPQRFRAAIRSKPVFRALPMIFAQRFCRSCLFSILNCR